jgi:anti-sigma B factor antagonist
VSLERQVDDGVCVLRATGELDVLSVPSVLPEVAALVAGAAGVVLDLTGVDFFDSSGVRLVDRLARECGRSGVPFRIAAPADCAARRVLEIVGMAGPQVARDLPAALAAVRAGV